MKRSILFLLMVLLFNTHTFSDEGRVLRSIVFPGMGQMGDGQIIKGLLYMGGEIALLSCSFEFLSRSNSYARNTEKLQNKLLNETTTALEQQETFDEWVWAKNQSDRDRMVSMGCAGVALGWWVWNVIDALVFIPEQSDELTLYKKVKDNLSVCVIDKGAKAEYTVKF